MLTGTVQLWHNAGRTVLLALLASIALTGCGSTTGGTTGGTAGTTQAQADAQPTIIVTYSVLGAVVRELVGDSATVVVPIPNGQDPHEWEPSAQDIAALTKASMIVQNGLGLEEGMERALEQAAEAGVPIFTAADHIEVRTVGPGEGLPGGDPDQAVGAQDPHLWLDPLAMKSVVAALAPEIKTRLGIDVDDRAGRLEQQLDELNSAISAKVATLPDERRKLVTGHESLGYFAQRYGFTLVGALLPSLTAQAEVSAADMASLKQQIIDNKVTVIFSELGTPPAVAETVAAETGADVVELTTHGLPEDGSYATFLSNLADTIVQGLGA